MDAKLLKCAAFCALFLSPSLSLGASFTTTNFVVTAPTDEIARKVANCAEFWRKDLAIQWLGETLPNWYKPCPISVRVGQIGAGGQTTFTFENGEVFGWKMQVQGSLERILDSVIPHEVNHTIFASYFRRPLPRWADEGAATLFEHDSERARQTRLLDQVLNTSRRIPLNQLLTIREYPEDMQDVLTLYAEGYSLAEFLVGSKGESGRAVYLRFLQDAHQQGWEKAISRNYGYRGVEELEKHWTNWILAGSPSLRLNEGESLAGTPATEDNDLVVRSQSPADGAPVRHVSDEQPPPLRSIPRRVRPASASIDRQSASVLRNADHSSSTFETPQPEGGRGAESQPEAEEPSQQPRPQLSPTAIGIETDAEAASYHFPEARK